MEIKISTLKKNPNNPRILKDAKFEKLKNSISEFPKMMELRPIVIDNDNIVLGGNMRLEALKALDYKVIPENWVKKANELTEEEKKRFIIADNVGFGEWNWDILANEWDAGQLDDWGLDVPNWSNGLDVNNMTDDDVDLEDEFDPIGTMDGKQRVVFLFDGYEEAESYLKSISVVDYSKKGQAWQVNMSTQYI